MKRIKKYPDLIMVNGNIRSLDGRLPLARSLSVSDGRILHVSHEDLKHTAGPETEILDLEGRTVLPGMTDTHFHYYDWAMNLRSLALAHVRSLGEMLESLRSYAEKKEAGDWIIGQGWNDADWPGGEMPNRDCLDLVAPDHPVILWRCDMHMAVANSRALERAGIDENTNDPPEGLIRRDTSGLPDGILKESAIQLVKAVIPEKTDDEVYAAFKEGIPVLHSLGLTGIHDVRIMGGAEGSPALKAWRRLRKAGELDLRCWATLPGEQLKEIVDLGLTTGSGDERLHIGHVKLFADGGMGARTAWMIEPYLDAERGMPLTPTDELEAVIRKAEKAGLSVMVHAIGDRANRELIGIFERVEADRTGVAPAIPHRMEHVQMIRPEDAHRLARLNIAACVQPHNMILDMNMVDLCVGEKSDTVYSFKTLMDAGIPVMFSSDTPVCDPNPLVGIHAAVTRQRRDNTPEEGWHPAQRVSVDQAVRAYTITPANVHGLGDELGSLTPGKLADMIVLDRDIYSINNMEIPEARVDLTLFDGSVVVDHR